MTISKNAQQSRDLHAFTPDLRDGVYQAILRRRDMRSFLPDPVSPETLGRVLAAASHAPSVGYMQPWDFTIVRNQETRQSLWRHVDQERRAAAAGFEESKREEYLSFKLEGIREAPLNLLVTCDTKKNGPAVVGRNTIREMDVYSVVCAVQNLWLAARAEGLGVGWVSILRNETLREIFKIPDHVIPVAYLCVGWVKEFPEDPLLRAIGWLPYRPMEDIVFSETWGERPSSTEFKDLRSGLKGKLGC
ncbi:MAG: 5,6-dimethylbenzimidazole synthase [Nitrospinota bacterium]|nr:5,6-dimethylbenzimidazole synthase [Nitrospinota bacterium]